MNAVRSAAAYRIDGKLVSDQAFYASACDPRRSVVVQACAGAGKTWMLVSRILRALLDGAEANQILAITFTRKAAGEMRERLDRWLAEFADPARTQAELVDALCQRGLPPNQAAAAVSALAALNGRLLAGGRAVEVRTFHGWFAQLIMHAPQKLVEAAGLPPRPELLEDISVLRGPLLRRFHRAVEDDVLLRQDFLALVRRHRRTHVSSWLDAMLQRSTEISCAIAAGTLETSVPPAREHWPECAEVDNPLALLLQAPRADLLDRLARELGALAQVKSQVAAQGLREALAQQDPEAAFDQAFDALFTAKGEPRKLKGSDRLGEACDALLQLRDMQTQQQAHEDHLRLCRLARVLLREFAALKRERGLADMADLERAALALLADGEGAAWVQERLDLRLRHVLIDEFQDTSPLQWHALQAWLSSYAGAGGGASGQRPLSVFIVGDPKQSIYRFRRAEPRVFEAASRFVTEGLEGQLLECDHTRRNASAVIEALNQVFGAAAAEGAWPGYRPHTTAQAEPGAVCKLPGVPRPPRQPAAVVGAVWRDSLTQPRHEPEEERRREEAEGIANAVLVLIQQQGVAPGEVMVLARKRSVLAVVADALARRQLPHVVPDALRLAESPEALDVIALLDVLASPAHDLSLARALKSPIFGADDADLLWLAQRGQPWWQGLMQGQPPSAALRRARALLADWAAQQQRLSPHDLLDRVLHDSQAEQRFAAAVPAARRAQALQALHALLATALAVDGARYTSLYRLVRHLRSGQAQADFAEPVDAVRLLTVHGAKGLEARVVFVADTDTEWRQAERATLLIDWRVEQAAPQRVAFVASESRVPASLAGLYAQEQAARAREELNGLYVAMTRARERLVFSHTEPHRPSRPSWLTRLAPWAADWSPAPLQPAPTASEASSVLLRLHPAYAPPSAQRPPVAEDPAAAALGQAVHRLLEWVGQPQHPLPRPAWPEAARAAAGAVGAPAAAVLAIVEAMMGQADCARFFLDPALVWAGAEVPLAVGGDLLRVDRLVAFNEAGRRHWWVLDFKLHPDPQALPAYREQLQRYQAAVQCLQPGDRVSAAWISSAGKVFPAGA